MKTKKLLFSLFCCVNLLCVAKPINPLTQAMLDGYATLLEQNPNDYLTLYERASQYYRLDDYDKALSDIKRAITCTPAKEKEQLASEYSLLTDIYTQLEQYPEALMAVDQALSYAPDSYPLLYMKGNTCLHLAQSDNAQAAFTAMQRINPRSTEAIFGLARVAALEKQNDKAIQYLNDAEKMAPGNYLTYCRMGDLHRELNMPQNAASDYLSAFSLTSESDRPIRSLIDLAKENYDAVDDAINYAISKTPNVIPLYFIQGNAAIEAGRYDDAYDAYRQLIVSIPDEDAQQLYSSMSEICLHKGDLQEADDYASKALMLISDERNNILKAVIEQCRGNFTSAQMYILSALKNNAASEEAIMRAADIAYSKQEYQEALKYLNELILNDADNADALLFRGYIQANKIGNKEAALSDFLRVANMDAKNTDMLARKAIAQLKAGMSLDASATIAPLYAATQTDPTAAYLVALYNIAADNNADAKRMLELAKKNGFNDNYLLMYATTPLLSVAPLR